MRRQGHLLCLLACAVLSGCSDRSQEMEEKVTQMQRQLDDTQNQLQAAKEALAKHNEAPRPTLPASVATSTGLPSHDAVEASYNSAVADFRKKLEANLGELKLQSCTLHSVQMPAELYPFTSQLSFAFATPDGKTFTTDVPVKADVNGKWVFPSADEVVQRIGNAQRVASNPTPANTLPAAERPSKADQPRPYMAVDGTFVVQWPDSSPSAAPARTATAPPVAATTATPRATIAASMPAATAPPRPQPTAAPSAPAVMPVDRDVRVQFPTPP